MLNILSVSRGQACLMVSKGVAGRAVGELAQPVAGCVNAAGIRYVLAEGISVHDSGVHANVRTLFLIALNHLRSERQYGATCEWPLGIGDRAESLATAWS